MSSALVWKGYEEIFENFNRQHPINILDVNVTGPLYSLTAFLLLTVTKTSRSLVHNGVDVDDIYVSDPNVIYPDKYFSRLSNEPEM
jgi:hypothetical protein